MVEFGILTERSDSVKEYKAKSDEQFAEKKSAQEIVYREIELVELPTNYLLKINFVCSIPSFKSLAIYLFLIGTLFSFIFKWWTFIPTLIVCFLLLLTDILQKPKSLYFAVKGIIRRQGYKGPMKFLNKKEMEEFIDVHKKN